MAQSDILILGAGAFGLSTAYHLAKSGYKNITILEKSLVVPPEQSAGNDLNKIVRAEYEDPFYTELALEAIKEWSTPLFSPYYRQVGYLLATTPAAPENAKATLQRALRSISNHPVWKDKIVPLNQRSDITSVAAWFGGSMNWSGYFNRLAGYARSADAMVALYSACCALKVQIKLGEEVRRLSFQGSRCTGAITASGETYNANTVIVTLGASVSTILPSIAPQIKGVGFAVAHIRLSLEEVKQLKGLPVTYARDLGYFFEPDAKTNLLKVCSAGAGYTWFDDAKQKSVPPPTLEESALITTEDEERMRELLRQSLPKLADRPLEDKRICWCADSADTNYIIDYVPGCENLMVASGDSAHGFKMFPVFGSWVKKLIEDRHQVHERWRWKNIELKGDEGISWRVGTRKDLRKMGQQNATYSKL